MRGERLGRKNFITRSDPLFVERSFLNRLQPSEEELICRTECLSNCTRTVWEKHNYDTLA